MCTWPFARTNRFSNGLPYTYSAANVAYHMVWYPEFLAGSGDLLAETAGAFAMVAIGTVVAIAAHQKEYAGSSVKSPVRI